MNNTNPSSRYWLIGLVALYLLSNTCFATNITFYDNVAYQIATNKQTVVLEADEIANNEWSGYSGTLRLELWAFASPYSGSASGYKMASYQLPEVLPGGYSYYNVNSGSIPFASPPPGPWNLSLQIREYIGAEGDGFVTRDYRNFPVRLRVAGGAYIGDVVIAGIAEWVAYTDNTARLSIDEIRSMCLLGTSGSLRVDLWATTTPYSGGVISGYRFFSSTLDPLPAENSYFDFDQTRPMYNRPPDGLYYVTLTISEYNDGDFLIIDSLKYTGLKAFGNVAPQITSQPQSQRVKAGSNVSFSAAAAGTKPLQYQWKVNGQNIANATNSTLTLSGVQQAWSGRKYTVQVINSIGSVLSAEATLTVYSCNYSLSSNSRMFNYLGGSASVTLTTTSDCAWNVVNNNAWITITSATSGSGNATITFNVAANNTLVPRTGTVMIGGKPFVIAQGAQYSPANFRGKTLVMSVTSGSGTLAASGKYLIVTSEGTNNTLQVVPIAGPTVASSAAYTFGRGSATRAFCVFNSITGIFDFTDPAAGSYTLSKPDGSRQAGKFMLVNKTADINGDGRGDIAWQNTSSRVVSSWLMSGTNWTKTVSFFYGQPSPAGWTAIDMADFNNDGRTDVLFQTSTGALAAWLMNGTNVMKAITLRQGLSFGTGWKALAASDFNGDSQPDVLFQHDDGRVALWTFNNTNYVSTLYVRNGLSAGTGWRVMATGDFNRDRQTDILFEQTSGVVALWLMNGASFVDSVALVGIPALGSTWRIAGAGDLNQDGLNDIYWQNSDGKFTAWLMNGRTYTKTELLRYGQLFSAGLKCIGSK